MSTSSSDNGSKTPAREPATLSVPAVAPESAETATLPPVDPAATGDFLTRTTQETQPRPLTIAGYEILDELGRGGMGVVYKARQTKLNRLVALKMVLAGGHAGEAELARFRAEAEAIARLQHPNIVQVYEIGESEGRPFFSLEFVSGGSLAGQLDGTPLPPQPAAQLVDTLARAMHAAHQAGVIHRDLKPANILLVSSGVVSGEWSESGRLHHSPPTTHHSLLTPKITDFGLAKQMDSAHGQTQSGAIVGTPSYMAPEQAGGKSKEIGPATDVYALGAILYELLTGRPPFKAATPLDTILHVISDEPVPPSQLQSKTPRDLETICLKCLHKEPGKRYASAAALADDVARFRKGEPIQARPVSRLERAGKWVKRNPAIAASLAAIALVTVLGVAGIYWKYRDAEEQRVLVQQALDQVTTEKENTERALTKSEWLVYAGNIGRAQEAWNDGRVADAWTFLNACREDFRGWEHDYLYTLFNKNQKTFRGHAGAVTSVAWSGEGKRIVSGSYDSTLKVWDSATGDDTLTLNGHTSRASSVAWSRDGKRIVSGSGDHTLKVWDATTGQETLTLNGHTEPVTSVACSRDGKRIVSGSDDKTLKVWNATTGQETLTLKGHTGAVANVAWSGGTARGSSAAVRTAR